LEKLFFPPKSLHSQTLTVNAIFQLVLFGIVLLGLGIAWKRELIGGIMALLAFILMAIINPNILKLYLMLLYPATAISFILLWAFSGNVLGRANKL
jgi:uncharacterized membrane protein